VVRRALVAAPDPERRSLLLSALADELAGRGEQDEAEAISAEALALARGDGGGDGGGGDGDGERTNPFLLFAALAARLPANRAGRALVQGRFGDAERLSTEMLAEYQETGSTIPFDAFCGQLFLLRWHQGRLAEIEGPLAEVAGHERIGQAFRAAMAVAHTELGRPDAARQLLALDRTSPRVRDFTWIATSCVLAEVVARLDDVAFAQSLYDELLPFAGQTAVVSTGVTCLGS